MSAMLIEQIASDAVLDEAYAWLCHRRRDYPAKADIWSIRPKWNVEKRWIQDNLLTNSYDDNTPIFAFTKQLSVEFRGIRNIF